MHLLDQTVPRAGRGASGSIPASPHSQSMPASVPVQQRSILPARTASAVRTSWTFASISRYCRPFCRKLISAPAGTSCASMGALCTRLSQAKVKAECAKPAMRRPRASAAEAYMCCATRACVAAARTRLLQIAVHQVVHLLRGDGHGLGTRASPLRPALQRRPARHSLTPALRCWSPRQVGSPPAAALPGRGPQRQSRAAAPLILPSSSRASPALRAGPARGASASAGSSSSRPLHSPRQQQEAPKRSTQPRAARAQGANDC